MFQTCFERGRRGQVLQSHPLPISPLLQTPEKWRPQKRRPQSCPYQRCGVDTEIPYRFPNSVEKSVGFCRSVWLPVSILNFRIRSVSSIGGLIAATLFAATVSDSQTWAVEIYRCARYGCRTSLRKRSLGLF